MIDAQAALVKEDRRADYAFNTESAADAVECYPRKFGEWWYRTRRKLVALYIAQPGQFASEFAGIIALAEQERKRRG